ncbi:hypothetical protein BZA05DRAFT_122190 [Tricharina praecox]|uniref:uncharacterized protein n=1 Tax=Tricharina praecox TaxID=43433 RepID=UPI00221EDC45|nr:uncharacterized protein BZA05DRAFT_122190 [Tricharina praecox]KAI5848198.1 hypothetical protein BZA05DRAFT_122190 [Tricharina praecox]
MSVAHLSTSEASHKPLSLHSYNIVAIMSSGAPSAFTRRPTVGDSLHPKKVLDMHDRDSMWSNGAVVCDKWLKHGKCSRARCRYEHRPLHPNEKPPLCADHFKRRDPCGRGDQCPLMHNMTGVGNSDGRISPVSFENDAAAAGRSVQPRRSENENIRAPAPISQNGDTETIISKKDRPDLPLYQPPPRRDSHMETTDGPRSPGWEYVGRTTLSASFEARPTAWHPSGRAQRDWGRGSTTASQASIFGGLPYAVQAGLNQEVFTQPRGFVAGPHRTGFAPDFIPKCISGALIPDRTTPGQLDNRSSHHVGASYEPCSPPGLSGGVPLYPTSNPKTDSGKDAGKSLMLITKLANEVNDENLSCKDTEHEDAFYHQIHLVELICGQHTRTSGLKPLPRALHERAPFLDVQPKLLEQQTIMPEVTIEHEPTSGANDPSKAIGLQITPSKTQPKLDKQPDVVPTVVVAHVVTNGVSRAIGEVLPHKADEQPADEQPAAVPEVAMADKVSGGTSGGTSSSESNKQPPITPQVAVTNDLPIDITLQTTQLSDDVPRAIGIPEWEIQRCFNCFHEGHNYHDCRMPRLDVLTREKIRDEQGVINRRWTQDLLTLHRHNIPSAVITKHRGYSRLWEPYTSATTGRYITPSAAFFSQRATNINNQAEKKSTCNKGVQTDYAVYDQGVRVRRRSSRNKKHRKKAEENKAEENTVEENKVESSPITPEKETETCWLCKGRHLGSACKATSPDSDPADWEDTKWMPNTNDLPQLPKKHALGRQISPKPIKSLKSKKGSKPSLVKSALVDSKTTTYKVERSAKDGFRESGDNDAPYEETVLDRDDLTGLVKLDKERKSKRRSSNSGQSSSVGSATFQSSYLCRCPNELLESIFAYAADGDAYTEDKKIKDIVTGNKWDIEEGVQDTWRRARNLAGVVKSCRQLRLVAQRVIYRVICIKSYIPLRGLARTLTADPELGQMVQVLKIHLEQTTISYKNRGVYRHEMVNNVHVTTTDYASFFVRIVESCRNLQILSTKLYGSALGFGALLGRFRHMREIVISDETSCGQVLNKMWNHLINFPKLNKFKIVHSPMNDSVDFTPLEIPFHMAERGLDYGFRALSNLQLENAPEVSDALLVFLVRRFYVLSKLAIVNCKLVTSAGIARVLGEIPNKLCHLIFWVWLDRTGRASSREALPSKYHLCDALREHGTSLMTMNLKPHKVCEDLWKESHFNHLQRIVIDMAQFSHCYKQTIARGETDKHEGFFEDAYKLACSEDRLPCMDESRLSIRLHTNGLSYH